MKNSSIMSCHILPCYALPYRRVMWVAVILHAKIDDKRSRHVVLCPGLEQYITVLISAVVVERSIKLTIRVSWENQILLPNPAQSIFFPNHLPLPPPHCHPPNVYLLQKQGSGFLGFRGLFPEAVGLDCLGGSGGEGFSIS